jgi:membrane-associated HD superfamily phosphohydrolase
MGANISKQTVESTTEIVSRALTSIKLSVTNKTSSYVSAEQVMSINLRNMKSDDFNLDITQKADIDLSTMLDSKNNLASDIANRIKAELTEQLANDLKQSNKDLNLGQMNISQSEIKGRAYLNQNLETLISSEVNNIVETKANGKQVINIDMSDSIFKKANIRISQDMIIKLLAKNIANNIINNVVENSMTSEIKKEMKNKAEQINSGVNLFAIIGVIILVVGGGGLYITQKYPAWKIALGVFIVFLIGCVIYYIWSKQSEKYETNEGFNGEYVPPPNKNKVCGTFPDYTPGLAKKLLYDSKYNRDSKEGFTLYDAPLPKYSGRHCYLPSNIFM